MSKVICNMEHNYGPSEKVGRALQRCGGKSKMTFIGRENLGTEELARLLPAFDMGEAFQRENNFGKIIKSFLSLF